ncbi:MAG: SGNH/GDSL hydrolase family protein [Granulosicoccus sp.]|nr:SGNH/GDSL hydrolase family protein [Granulosicoccus sp.]
MNRHIRFYLLISILLLPATASYASTDYSDIVIFGDSFSDIGNSPLLPPPYSPNRFSNGPVAIELVAQKLGLSAVAAGPNGSGNNFAAGGAKASGGGPIDLPAQVGLFLTSRNNIIPTDALYVLFIGGNDLRDARNEFDFNAGKLLVKQASESVERALDALVAAGARNILLINAPNIGAIPETRMIAAIANDPAPIIESRKLSRIYKRKLRRLAYSSNRSIKHQIIAGSSGEINIIEFDLFNFFRKLLKKAHRFGFTNTTDACIDVLADPPEFNAGCGPDKLDDHVFLDAIHPTAKVHAIVADAIYDVIIRSRYHRHTYRKWPGRSVSRY